MSKLQDSNYLKNEQYKTSKNLNARIRLHAEFSTNTYGWFQWVFDHYRSVPKTAKILEIGCGPGDLWQENADRIPSGWEITVSDFSPGMVAQAQENISKWSLPFKFEVINAESIPRDNAHFDAVIANHCLYHFPNRPKAFSEIRRVLKDGGQFFATTAGKNHLKELPELIRRFDSTVKDEFGYDDIPFTLENGYDQICKWFSKVEIHRYPCNLQITDAAVLTDYILSTIRANIAKDRRAALLRFIEHEMAHNGGEIYIQKDSGIFIAS